MKIIFLCTICISLQISEFNISFLYYKPKKFTASKPDYGCLQPGYIPLAFYENACLWTKIQTRRKHPLLNYNQHHWAEITRERVSHPVPPAPPPPALLFPDSCIIWQPRGSHLETVAASLASRTMSVLSSPWMTSKAWLSRYRVHIHCTQICLSLQMVRLLS